MLSNRKKLLSNRKRLPEQSEKGTEQLEKVKSKRKRLSEQSEKGTEQSENGTEQSKTIADAVGYNWSSKRGRLPGSKCVRRTLLAPHRLLSKWGESSDAGGLTIFNSSRPIIDLVVTSNSQLLWSPVLSKKLKMQREVISTSGVL